MEILEKVADAGAKAKVAARALRALNGRRKSVMLQEMADAMEAHRDEILRENAADIAALSESDQSASGELMLNGAKLGRIVREIRTIADLKEPIGHQISRWIRPNGIKIVKERVPLGVVAVVFDLSATVIGEAMGMCVKTANALVMLGGARSQRTAKAIHSCMLDAAVKKGLPADALPLLDSAGPEALEALVGLEGTVDLVIPRGDVELEEQVVRLARVPVIRQSVCGCHVFVDASADQEMALGILENAVCSGPGRRQRGGTLLVHTDLAAAFLPKVAQRMSEREVEMRGHGASRRVLNNIVEASDADWCSAGRGEALCIRVVSSVEDAVSHVICYGCGDSECIVTEDDGARKLFVRSIDAPCVYANASPALTNGPEFGMGPEIAVSTGKLHARGPLGLDELTTYHYVIQGTGQVRE